MSRAAAAVPGGIEKAEQLSAEQRRPLRDLILTLADNKRLLGIRYSDWMLGAPSLETGIAASSMAQDEWGHSRLTYALLGDLGEDPKRLEHGREADAYHTLEVLDSPLTSWAEMIAAVLLLDTALTIQYEALAESRYTPVRNRVQKLLDEEEYHFQYAVGWVQRLAASGGLRAPLQEAVDRFLPVALRWFGRAEASRPLEEEGIVTAGADALRARFLERVGPVLAEVGLQGGSDAGQEWSGWDDARRRATPGGPDAETLARVRGDLNRAMLLD